MAQQSEKLDQLLRKLELLMQQQATFQKELDAVQKEIINLKSEEEEFVPELPKKEVPKLTQTIEVPIVKTAQSEEQVEAVEPSSQKLKIPSFNIPKTTSEFEKFIGENLASKVGILITVLGVAIGAKYAIDNQLISPLTRIVLGYLVGAGLLGFAMKLKPKYENLSAVLLSGAMVIFYFITFFAYDLYGLIPQVFAFVLMVVFTIFTVFAALQYDRQIIAHLGLVGAYAVPFLLSNDSGNALVLFSYMAVLNIGILYVSIHRYWKALFNSAFYFTWMIFLFWSFSDYQEEEHFALALIFSTLFFGLFYATFLAYKVRNDEVLEKKNIALLLFNSFIYFGIGYGILIDAQNGEDYLGLFAVFNGILHFVVCRYVYKQELADKNLFYFTAGLVLVFITIAVPIQLDGNWVTLIWGMEAALLFWIGRTKGAVFYEKLSFALMILGFLSLMDDWNSWTPNYYYYEGLDDSSVTPFLNINFLTGILFAAAFAFILWIQKDEKYPNPFEERAFFNLHRFLIPGILLVVLYNVFRIEIMIFFENEYFASLYRNEDAVKIFDKSILLVRDVWLVNYSMVFLSLLTYFNLKKGKTALEGQVNFGLNVFGIITFLMIGLFLISDIRENYINNVQGEIYPRGIYYQYIRYISIGFFACLLFTTHKLSKATFAELKFPKIIETGLYVLLIWLLSSELLHWMDIYAAEKDSYKTALSILWGAFSLIVVWIGIAKQKRHLRLSAMVLFGITLLKLFFYDLAHLSTISKTIALVSLGVLLLLISYLYNRFTIEEEK